MKSNYKRLGDYIQKVDIRNRDLEDLPLMGLSITKEFISSIANTIGTDMSTYRVIERNQFAYGPVTSRNGDKITIALFYDFDKALISQAYTPFEVTDLNKIDPEYLMMWFRRPEFDRYARFKSHGSAREIFDWDEMCNVELPIPSIEKQRAIVAEYNTIQNRIDLNNQLIQKLEETAQTIYREWFVDGIDKENLPEGWEIRAFTSAVKFSGGGTPDTTNELYWNGQYPFFTPADISDSYYCIETEKTVSELGLKNSSTKLYPKNTVFVTARGTVGAIALAGSDMTMNQSCYAISGQYLFFTHQLTIETIKKLKNEAVGAVFAALVTKDFDSQNVIYPTEKLQAAFDTKVSVIYELILVKSKENQKLEELKGLLLSKLATIEN
ncbi:MAG: restriction endonuclease subunit S [Chitinophagales bacterium]|nr:restriction endonuclease subunit S [Chitinophagales bacterium]